MKVTKDYLTEANTMVTRRTRTELGYNSVIEKIKHSQSSYSVLSEESLIHAMDYLQGMKSTNRTSDEFVNHSRNIIEEINKTYPKQKQFKVWLRFLDIINKVQGDYSGNDDFKIGINKIFEELIDSNKGYIDWRIARKMLDVGNIFDFRGLSIKFSDILASIRKEISISEEILLFRTKSESTKLAKQYLSDLKKIIDDPNQQQLLKSAIISGRFDKKKFNLDKTMILGEDGGLYILLNRLNKSEQKMIGSIVGSDYLQDKLVNQNESLNNEVVNNDSKKKQLNIQKSDAQDFIIGKGGFGVVKFALSLINNDSDPGDIICIKKTSNFNKLKQTGGSFKPTPLERATISTMGDYFTSNIAKDIYSPNIYDMSLVTNKNYIDSAHQKGYLMMQLFPQNTATKIFVEDTSYRKWEHQKPYLVNIITTLNLMLDDNIVMTDLKPDNTLYDTGLRKASIIDLGGTVKLNSKEELYQFVRNNYSFQSTEGFIAPELSNQKPGDEPIDISKALSYSYGKLMQAVTSGVDYKPRSKMKNLIGKWVQKITNKTDYQPYYEIQTLTKKLIKEKPDERLEFEAIKHQLVAIGSDAYKDIAIYEHYINQIKTRIKKKPESISINQDILKTQKTLITQETTTLDPEEYKTLKTSNLFEKIDNFLQTENRNDQNKAFLLLVFI